MSKQDLNSFDQKKDNEEEKLNDNDNVCYEFEVKKSQEEREDFKIFNGFNVRYKKLKLIMKHILYINILYIYTIFKRFSYQKLLNRKLKINRTKKFYYI